MTLDKDFAHYRIVGRLGAGGMGGESLILVHPERQHDRYIERAMLVLNFDPGQLLAALQ